MLDLEPIKKRLAAATPGPWDADTTKSEGSYGNGDGVHEGYNAYELCAVVNQKVVVLADSLNSTHGMVEVEYDQDGASAWDEIARRNFDLIAYAPTDLAALIAEVERLRGALVAAEADPLRGVSRALRDDMVLQADLAPDGRLVCTLDRNLWNAWAEAIGDLASPATTNT